MTYGIRRRARKADQFVQIDNAFLRDESISIEARGMGAYLLTHSEGFRVSAATLGKACKTGREKTRRIVKELEDAGYLLRETERSKGKFSETEYSMSDEKAQVVTSDRKAVTAEPSPVDQSPKTSAHKKTNSENTKEKNTNPPGGDASAAPVTEPALPPAEDGGLFDDAPFRPEPEPAPPRPFSAADVVAAYVDSYREDSGRDPLKSSIKTVGSHAKRLLADGVEQELLLSAARRLGKTMYASLGREVAIMHRGAGASPARGTRRPLGVVHTPEERQEQRDWFAEQRQLQEERRRAEGTSTTFEENAQ